MLYCTLSGYFNYVHVSLVFYSCSYVFLYHALTMLCIEYYIKAMHVLEAMHTI